MARKNGALYVIDQGMSRVQRAAHYLDWFAHGHPGEWVAWNELCRAIQGYQRKLLLKSDEVEHLRKNSSSIKKVLFEKYAREVISLPGVGVRASIDDSDVLKHVVPKRASRLTSARNSFVTTVEALDPRNIPNTPEMLPHKVWLNHAIKDVMKQIGSPEFALKLLPPATETKEEDVPSAVVEAA